MQQNYRRRYQIVLATTRSVVENGRQNLGDLSADAGIKGVRCSMNLIIFQIAISRSVLYTGCLGYDGTNFIGG